MQTITMRLGLEHAARRLLALTGLAVLGFTLPGCTAFAVYSSLPYVWTGSARVRNLTDRTEVTLDSRDTVVFGSRPANLHDYDGPEASLRVRDQWLITLANRINAAAMSGDANFSSRFGPGTMFCVVGGSESWIRTNTRAVVAGSESGMPLPVCTTPSSMGPPAMGCDGMGVLNITPSSVTFPDTALGLTSAPIRLTVQNTAAGCLTVRRPNMPSDEFRIVSTDCVPMTQPEIDDGQAFLASARPSCEIEVAFAPQAGGWRPAMLALSSSDPVAAHAQVTLGGLGLAGVLSVRGTPRSDHLCLHEPPATFDASTSCTQNHLTLHNDGPGEVTIRSLSAQAGMAVDQRYWSARLTGPSILAPMGDREVVVQQCGVVRGSTREGPFGAELVVAGNHGNSPLTFPLYAYRSGCSD